MSNFKLKNNRFRRTANFYVSGAIDPWFITGFVDAEGSFIIKMSKSLNYKKG